MKPQVDAIWNASGYASSPNFDDAGDWSLDS
jgi:hypothetical protein